MPKGSRIASLLRAAREAIIARVLEEAEEVTRAACQESDRRVAEEAADVLYHFRVLAERGVEPGEVQQFPQPRGWPQGFAFPRPTVSKRWRRWSEPAPRGGPA